MDPKNLIKEDSCTRQKLSPTRNAPPKDSPNSHNDCRIPLMLKCLSEGWLIVAMASKRGRDRVRSTLIAVLDHMLVVLDILQHTDRVICSVYGQHRNLFGFMDYCE